MNTSCSIPRDVPLGLLTQAGELVVHEEVSGVQLLALMQALIESKH